MKKEHIFDKLKYVVRTVVYKHKLPDWNIRDFLKTMDTLSLLNGVADLSPDEMLWLETNYNAWLQDEMLLHKEVIEKYFNTTAILGREL